MNDSTTGTTTRLLQRQILPIDRDTDVFPLYVDLEDAKLDTDRFSVGGSKAAKDLNNAAIRQSTSTGRKLHPDQIRSRTALRLEPSQLLSFGTYFNAFPASYWRRHTIVTDVELTVHVTGAGSAVTVYKSMARGHSQRVDSGAVEGEGADASGSFTFTLPLKPFVDGGWYWYDVVAGDHGCTVDGAEWTAQVPADRCRPRHRGHLHHHDAARHERAAAGPARRRRRAPALPRHGLRDGPGQGQGHRQRVLPRRQGRPRATSSTSSSRATWAAPAATPAASARASARAPRRTP